MAEVTITKATSADITRILAIRYAAFSNHAPAAYSPKEVETLLDDADEAGLVEMAADSTLFVAWKSDEIVGVAGWKGPHLRHVYVDPAHTRQGIASQLLEVVESDFRASTGADHIDAGIALYAEGFYIANGYRVLKRATAWDGSGYFEVRKDFNRFLDEA
jgi:ribosomal protein S18 acetylase RimI-like enzyme